MNKILTTVWFGDNAEFANWQLRNNPEIFSVQLVPHQPAHGTKITWYITVVYYREITTTKEQ